MSCVSVIIPAYNKAEYTCRAVDSVLAQTYPDVEVIVVNDGSTDETEKRLAVYGNRIQYILKKNGGACSARNLGIERSKGDFIALLDCDDLYLPNKLELSVKFLQEHSQVGFVHSKAYLIDQEDRAVSIYERPENRIQGKIAKRLIFGNYICNSTVVIRRDCLNKVGLFDESIFTPADWDLWLRLAENFEAGFIDQPLTKYRIADNYIFNRLELAQREEHVVIERYFKRNGSQSGFLKKQVLSNWHLRFAQCYLLREQKALVTEALRQTVFLNPLNMKAWAFLFLYIFSRSTLVSVLRRKILRFND